MEHTLLLLVVKRRNAKARVDGRSDRVGGGSAGRNVAGRAGAAEDDVCEEGEDGEAEAEFGENDKIDGQGQVRAGRLAIVRREGPEPKDGQVAADPDEEEEELGDGKSEMCFAPPLIFDHEIDEAEGRRDQRQAEREQARYEEHDQGIEIERKRKAGANEGEAG